jgi:adenylosuccinate synthase
VVDLKHPSRLRELIVRGCEHANMRLAAMGSGKRADAEHTMVEVERVGARLLALADDLGVLLHRAVRNGASVLMEGAQGSLLDVDHGTYPFVTSSSTTVGGAATGAGLAPTAIHAALGIVKAYTTRVGNGPLPTELDTDLGERIRQLGNEFGATTGRPRRCGWFDAVVVRYATRVNGLTGLAVTKLDVLDTLDKVALCSGYRVGDEVLQEFPADITALEQLEPVYEWMEGWRRSTGEARTIADLPRQARAYLDRLEAMVETPIRYVSVGTRRDQIIDVAPVA